MRLAGVVAVLCLALLVGASATAQQPTPQELFRTVLLDDAGTTSGVKRLLRTQAGFVSPATAFADLTGDGKSDAVVTVEDGGIAGVVATYVLTAEGSDKGDLRVALRVQSLYQGSVRVSGPTVVIAVPRWVRGDDACCTGRSTERDYAWDAAKKAFAKQATRTVSGD